MSNVKNLQALGKLKGYCTGYGGAYNPGQQNLQVDALNTLEANATQVMMEITGKQTGYDNITNKREIAFKGIRHLSSRIVSVLKASGAHPLTIKDAQTSTRKIWGRKAKPSVAAKVATQAENAAQQPKQEFTYGRDYATIAAYFDKLVSTVAAEPKYIVIEPDLSVAGLQATVAALHGLNQGVTQAEVDLSGVRRKRDGLLYKDEGNLYATAVAVKQYVRGAFGFNSAQRAEVSKLRFSKPRR